MRPTLLPRCALLLVPLLIVPATARGAKTPRLHVPPDWRIEDTEYPPAWAKTLPWKGRLQLRFPKGFFRANDDYTWSYPIFYWLEGDVLDKQVEFDRALRAYDAGLYGGQFAAQKIKIEFGKTQMTTRHSHAVVRWSITLHGFDPFVTKKPLTTHLEVFRWYCPKTDHTAVLILRSPRPFDTEDKVWKDLLQFWEKMDCH